MGRSGIASRIAFALAGVVALGVSAQARDAPRFVPQLALTNLQPSKVAVAPDDATLLLVVNSHVRIDVFDISNPGRPVKITEIITPVQTAEFTPKGTPRDRMGIVSGGVDGTVRLWSLDGKAIGEPFKGHDGVVNGVAFSPDGARIVSGGADGTVRLWTRDGKAAAPPFKGHSRAVLSVAFSPDGTRIVSGGQDGTLRLWTLDGRSAEPFAGHRTGGVTSVAFSPDGTRIVSGGQDGTLRLWTLDGRSAEPFAGHSDIVTAVAFSPDGTRIVSCSHDGTVRLWTLHGGEAARPFKGHDGGVQGVAFSPDGTRIVSSGGDGTVRFWVLDGKATEFRTRTSVVLGVAFSPDGAHIASAGSEGLVLVWAGTQSRQLRGHVGFVSAVAFSPDGRRLVSGGNDGTVRLWALDGRSAEPVMAHPGVVNSVAFAPDGTHIASGGTDGAVRLWTSDGKPAAEPFKGHVRSILSVAFSPNSARIATGGQDGTVRLWTLDGKPAAEPFAGHGLGGVMSVAFSPDGTRIVSGGVDGTVRLWTLDGRAVVQPFRGHDGAVRSVAFSPDGARVVSGGQDDTVRLWTLDGEPAAEPFKGGTFPFAIIGQSVTSVAFSPDGTGIVSGRTDGMMRLWTLEGREAAEPLRGQRRGFLSVALLPDGSRIVSGSTTGLVQLWTLDGKAAVEPFTAQDGTILSVAVSPDGQRIASGGTDRTVRLSTVDGKPAADPFRGHTDWIYSVAFSPDGTRIASGARDGTVRLWTLDGKAAAEPFKGHAGVVSSIAFSPDGTRIVSSGHDGTVRLWTLDGKPAAEPLGGRDGEIDSVAFAPDGAGILACGRDRTLRLWAISARTSSTAGVCIGRKMGFLRRGQFWVQHEDRIVLHDDSLKALGEIFLSREGAVALVYSEGAYIPNDQLAFPFRAVGEGGSVDWSRRAVAEIPMSRVRQVLFDDWTWSERVGEFVKQTYAAIGRWYQSLGWLKAPFWPALGWLIAVVAAICVWIFAPHKLADWTMSRVGSAEIPVGHWKWLAGVVLLFGFLGTTRRAARAWLRRNRAALYEQNFSGRAAVKERERYCVLAHEADVAAFARDLLTPGGARMWIDGVGGAGKTALSFQVVRTASAPDSSAPLPLLVDEDWDGPLTDHIAQLLRLNERVPTRKMVEVLGAAGDLFPVVDSLSERGMPDALSKVAAALDSGALKSMVVTSRRPPPASRTWQNVRRVTALPLTDAQVPDYVAAYAPPDRHAEVLRRIEPLVAAEQSLSPLFLRFAIEQALAGEVTSISTLDLVLKYVEALRGGKIDISADDMLRAASTAAKEAVRESLVPREIEQSFLRGVLVTEADALPFMSARNDKAIDPAAVIEMLVQCGLLNRNRTNRRLQFAYDPVAEQLAARVVVQGGKDRSLARLKKRILSEPGSGIARAMGEIELAAASAN